MALLAWLWLLAALPVPTARLRGTAASPAWPRQLHLVWLCSPADGREVLAVVRGQATCHISLPSLATTEGCVKREKVVLNSSAARGLFSECIFNFASCFSQCVFTFVLSLSNP